MDAITVVQMNDDAVPAFLGYWGPLPSFPYTGPTAPGTEAKDVTWSSPAGQPTGTTIADWISARRKEGKMILASATPSNAALFTNDPGNVLMLVAAKPENAKLYASSHIVVFKAGGWPTWAWVALGAVVVGGLGYVVAKRKGYVPNGSSAYRVDLQLEGYVRNGDGDDKQFTFEIGGRIQHGDATDVLREIRRYMAAWPDGQYSFSREPGGLLVRRYAMLRSQYKGGAVRFGTLIDRGYYLDASDESIRAASALLGRSWYDTFLRVREPPLTYETDLDDFYF